MRDPPQFSRAAHRKRRGDQCPGAFETVNRPDRGGLFEQNRRAAWETGQVFAHRTRYTYAATHDGDGAPWHPYRCFDSQTPAGFRSVFRPNRSGDEDDGTSRPAHQRLNYPLDSNGKISSDPEAVATVLPCTSTISPSANDTRRPDLTTRPTQVNGPLSTLTGRRKFVLMSIDV